METILQVKQIEKIYGNKGSITRAIEDISFEVKKGEFVGIMDPPDPARRRCSTASRQSTP